MHFLIDFGKFTLIEIKLFAKDGLLTYVFDLHLFNFKIAALTVGNNKKFFLIQFLGKKFSHIFKNKISYEK